MSQKTQLLCLITLNLLPYGKIFGSENHTFSTNNLFYKTAYFLKLVEPISGNICVRFHQ